MYTLGINAAYHDQAACLVRDGCVLAAAEDETSDLGPGPRGRLKAAKDYLAVAPEVVAVVKYLELGAFTAELPRTPTDHAAVVALSERWNLESPLARVVDAMSSR